METNSTETNLKIIADFFIDQRVEIQHLLIPLRQYLYTSDNPEKDVIISEALRKIDLIEDDVQPLLDKMNGSYSDKAKAILQAMFRGKICQSRANLIMDKIYNLAK